MKKLITCFLAIIAILNYVTVNAQNLTADSKVPTSIKLIGKFHAVITYLETKDFYKSGVTEASFIKAVCANVDDIKVIEITTPYLKTIYSYHLNKLTSDQVYDKTTGEQYALMHNQLTSYIKTIGDKPSKLKKPKWFNWLRKLIDFIDDNWDE